MPRFRTVKETDLKFRIEGTTVEFQYPTTFLTAIELRNLMIAMLERELLYLSAKGGK